MSDPVPSRSTTSTGGTGRTYGDGVTDQRAVEPDRLVEKGHGAGDVLEAWRWLVLERGQGQLLVEVQLPDQLKNPQGQLFGGFTTTYIDFVSLHTVHASEGDERDPSSPKDWLTTLNLHCDYFEPIVQPTFTIRGEVLNQRGMNYLVSTKFFQGDPAHQTMAAHGLATLRRVPVTSPTDDDRGTESGTDSTTNGATR